MQVVDLTTLSVILYSLVIFVLECHLSLCCIWYDAHCWSFLQTYFSGLMQKIT